MNARKSGQDGRGPLERGHPCPPLKSEHPGGEQGCSRSVGGQDGRGPGSAGILPARNEDESAQSGQDGRGPGARASSPPAPRGWHSRGYLPHFDAGAIPQFITFRLHASFPKHLLDTWKVQLEHLERTKADEALRERIEEYLDCGHGTCCLRDPRIGELVQNALLFFDGERYRLHRWVVMPNHVHCLITPAPTQSLSAILHSWKSFTGNQANRILGRRGAFWDEDYFDRYVRDELNFSQVVYYIDHNPVEAKLCRTPEEWPFSSAGHGRKTEGGLEGRAPGPRASCPPGMRMKGRWAAKMAAVQGARASCPPASANGKRPPRGLEGRAP